jgi:hypothetical protein
MNASWIYQDVRASQGHEETAFDAEFAEAQSTQRRRDFSLLQMAFSAISGSLRTRRRKSCLFVIHAIACKLAGERCRFAAAPL